MSRVAIVGSCITRDLWRFRGHACDVALHYVSRTSLASLFASSPAGFMAAEKPPARLKPQPHRALVADIEKTAMAGLVAFRPTHILFEPEPDVDSTIAFLIPKEMKWNSPTS